MSKPLRILLLEDLIDDANLLQRLLKKEGMAFTSLIVETREDFERGLEEYKPDVVISDHTLPQFDSLEALKLFKEYKREKHPMAVFILVTGTVSEEFAVEIMKKGADDYILKDRLTRLPTAIQSARDKQEMAELRRKVEEEKYHLLEILECSLHEIYVFNPESFQFDYSNEEALRNLGYTLEELKEMTPMDVIEECNPEIFADMLSRVEESAKGKIYEKMALRKDGSTYPIQIHLQFVEHGSQKRYLANVLDMSDLKKQEQQKELALFIQNVFNENEQMDRSLEIILEEICRSSRAPAAEFFIKNFDNSGLRRFARWNMKIPGPSDAGCLLAEMARKKGSSIFCKDLQQELVSGKEKDMEDFRSAVVHPIHLGKEVIAVITIFSKEQVEDEEVFFRLSESVQDQLANNIKRKKTEVELAKIFEISPDVMVVVGIDGRIKKANPSFYNNFGYSHEELQTLQIRDVIHPEDSHTLVDWQNAILDKKEVSFHQNRYKTKKGEYKWFSWSSTPFMDEGLSFSVGKDITEQKKQIHAIQVQNQKLTEIAWEQSHIVRGPLTRMMSCIAHIEEDGEHSRQLLKSIKDSAYELDDIIKTIVNKTEHLKEV